MTIDPNNFEPQGKPTLDQARTVWDAMKAPSSRKVANELINRGFDISWRTIARWHAQDWRDKLPQRHNGGGLPLSERGQVRGVRGAIRQELAKIPRDTVKQADQLTISDGAFKLAEEVVVEQRRQELLAMSEAELDTLEAKSRKVMNILLAEQSARRAHVMVLIPKDTGSLVGALADAQKVGLTGGLGQVPATGDPRVINGSAIHEVPENPLAGAIDRFLADHEVA